MKGYIRHDNITLIVQLMVGLTILIFMFPFISSLAWDIVSHNSNSQFSSGQIIIPEKKCLDCIQKNETNTSGMFDLSLPISNLTTGYYKSTNYNNRTQENEPLW
jgi:hypothetical protein